MNPAASPRAMFSPGYRRGSATGDTERCVFSTGCKPSELWTIDQWLRKSLSQGR